MKTKYEISFKKNFFYFVTFSHKRIKKNSIRVFLVHNDSLSYPTILEVSHKLNNSISTGYLAAITLPTVFLHASLPMPLASFTFADFNFGKSCHIWFLAIVLVLCVRLVRSCCCLNLLGFCFFACCFWFYCLPFLCAATASLMAFPLALVQIGFNRGLLCHRLPSLRLPLLHLHFLRVVYGFLVFAIFVFAFACCLRMENCGWKCDVSGRTLTGLKCDIRTNVCVCV